ncbi:NAD(+) diphosphatase [Heliobacillus mobilis]|uniref:NAD(+) diphosphatase n=1 Tax=Heliobacterium mobile TaxID=28064 RepID=A0A6I3SQ30_HELMO|nr:NAD(+) diphosphatase [Heliobacterium mobile]MTV51009.1 NAD(+) diphosphatase [Heliobacterium mobile]
MEKHTYWFIFNNSEVLIKEVEGIAHIVTQDDIESTNMELSTIQPIGQVDENSVYVASIGDTQPPQGFSYTDLRRLYGRIEEQHFFLAMRALHIFTWLEKNQFCGCCGRPLTMSSHELALQCENCGHLVYPRISPAIIVAVVKDDQILLARPNRVPQPEWYSVLAGFVEPGETLEDCVKREVKEEVGIEVDHIQYFGSQPWPFPDSLMIGFTAQYAAGEITIDPVEIGHADWFSVDHLPTRPASFSIAHRLIEWFISSRHIRTMKSQGKD